MSSVNPDEAGTAEQRNKRRRRLKRVPQGEFVWVLSGKTHHPARLVVPRMENQSHATRHSQVEISWTQTGFFEWVDQQSISYEEEQEPRQQRTRRISSSVAQEQGTPLRRRSTRKQSTPASRATTKTAKATPAKGTFLSKTLDSATVERNIKEEKELGCSNTEEGTVQRKKGDDGNNLCGTNVSSTRDVCVADPQEHPKTSDKAKATPEKGTLLSKTLDSATVERNVKEEKELGCSNTGDTVQRRKGEDASNLCGTNIASTRDACVADPQEHPKTCYKASTTFGGVEAPMTFVRPTTDQKRPLENAENEWDEEPPAKKQKKSPTTRSITPPPLSPVDEDSNSGNFAVESSNAKLKTYPSLVAAAKASSGEQDEGGNDEDQAQKTTDGVLDSISTPLSSAKRMVVSGLLELYKGFLGSSSSSSS